MDFVRGMKFALVLGVFATALLNAHTTWAQEEAPSELPPVHASQASDSQQAVPAPYTEKPQWHQFYLVDDANIDHVTIRTPKMEPSELMTPGTLFESFVSKAKVAVVNLLRWNQYNYDMPVPTEKYMRKLHFGRWINDPADETCMNTRAKVLVRDSKGEVTYRNGKFCVVEDGKWDDPYTNTELTSSRQIQIDHMVPLKNAYMSGAFNWDYKLRCLYANYMGMKEHLVSAEAHQNMSKGDSGPEGYLPPYEPGRCQYIRNWLAIKMIWRLTVNPEEAQAINDNIVKYGCKASDFVFTKDELDNQRNVITQNLNFCMVNKR
ncbi:HNH endonuclease family protein [Bdellovibrio sp. SKB1291214]|uniref:GmrSD restriction endonuclease domain-containing protein n=1 Tax=Bdellovibrio sp. SKB1291214 TaxID=1732569 RepID=UPI000B5154FE|nr:DUF1524 domain-containing protein [Bdellovibrio sp. SKB1291214]UYL07931.1 HNH endonuclease family protein [Bdellovibrio sp. SKB1291214]